MTMFADRAGWRSRLQSRRLIAVGLLLLIVVTATLVNGGGSEAQRRSDDALIQHGGSPPEAVSSAWYCPITYARRNGPATGAVVLTNMGPDPVSAVATVFPTGGEPLDAPLNIAARTRTTFVPATVVDADFAAVLVRVDGGGLSVEHGVRDVNGESWSQCSVETSSSWHVADGSTDAAELRIALFNPFSDYAIADIAASTDAGRAEPEQYRGIVVPARSLIVVNLGEQMRRRMWISSTVDVRRGRLAVEQLQTGSLRNVPGISLSLAAPSTQGTWDLANGVVSAGVTDRVTLYNPSETEARATVLVTPEGDVPPVELTMFVPGLGRVARDLDKEPGIPPDVRTAVSVTSDDGVGVVASRTATATGPAQLSGYSISVGTPVQARRWSFAPVGTSDPYDAWMWGVTYADPTEVRVSLIGDGVVRQVRNVRIDRGKLASIHIDELEGSAGKTVLVEADKPVAMARELRRIPGPTLSGGAAVPLR